MVDATAETMPDGWIEVEAEMTESVAGLISEAYSQGYRQGYRDGRYDAGSR